MDFKKISDNAYLEWFTEHYGKNPGMYGKEDLPEFMHDDKSVNLFLLKFAQDISLLTIKSYHSELAKKLKEYDIDLESLEIPNKK